MDEQQFNHNKSFRSFVYVPTSFARNITCQKGEISILLLSTILYLNKSLFSISSEVHCFSLLFDELLQDFQSIKASGNFKNSSETLNLGKLFAKSDAKAFLLIELFKRLMTFCGG